VVLGMLVMYWKFNEIVDWESPDWEFTGTLLGYPAAVREAEEGQENNWRGRRTSSSTVAALNIEPRELLHQQIYLFCTIF
jgi:hypothetical protein